MKALLKNVLTNHEKGRPMLIGTTSVEDSENMLSALQDLNITARVLNARPENVEREAEVVAQAGRLGAVTVATNMAGESSMLSILCFFCNILGRGTDILLGGSAKGVAKSLTKYLMFYHLKLMSAFNFDPSKYESIVGQLKELETDEDVLALPPIQAFVDALEIWLPTELDANAEIDLKRAVISACDTLADEPTRLDVEVI